MTEHCKCHFMIGTERDGIRAMSFKILIDIIPPLRQRSMKFNCLVRVRFAVKYRLVVQLHDQTTKSAMPCKEA